MCSEDGVGLRELGEGGMTKWHVLKVSRYLLPLMMVLQQLHCNMKVWSQDHSFFPSVQCSAQHFIIEQDLCWPILTAHELMQEFR